MLCGGQAHTVASVVGRTAGYIGRHSGGYLLMQGEGRERSYRNMRNLVLRT